MNDGTNNVVSIVIPVYNDDDALKQLLTGLSPEIHGDPDVELIVAAAGAADSTQAIADRFNAKIVISDPGRGSQMNHGAAATKGHILWFLHADSVPPNGAISAIRDVVASGGVGGWFTFRFSGNQSKAKSRLAALINWRAKHGVAYGDQGLFFTRAVFEQQQGFDDVPLFEEVRLVKACKATGRFLPLPSSIGVDDRRWQKDGWIRRTLLNRALAIGHACGVAPDTLARWYKRQRHPS